MTRVLCLSETRFLPASLAASPLSMKLDPLTEFAAVLSLMAVGKLIGIVAGCFVGPLDTASP